ncbi:MAG: glycosyltransferase family 39 protein [Oxalicibacterium faecigallinarum]|uniref:glycosyltransferase family 39 protein n=1 Tax=Oxalicibacterium faecigallinarum TaxID=573741 RepID=UPI0028066024|nr:glycosyltransferase family 39 protein [Oxalicibacterium faecigallinarum]MDQ7969155.1 glycosyltransferase family 39 protein [Oxalicibacterium faecigallinarum]
MSTHLPDTGSRRLFSLHTDNLVPIVLALLLLHLALWTIFTGLSHRSPDWDNMEELVWASGLEWGYYKHPPLPSWILHVLTLVFDRPVWLTFFTGQLSVVLALWMLWKLGCEFTSQQRSLIATLLVSLIAYFTVRGVMNNHNTMQLWTLAGAIWMLYRATRTDSLWAWAALGFFSGCAFLTKYSALVQFAVFFLYLLLTGHLKRGATWKGIVLSTAIVVCMVTPHLLWLKQQTVGPVAYASHQLTTMTSYANEISDLFGFLITNLGRIALMIVATFIVAIWSRDKRGGPAAKANGSQIANDLARSDKFFVLFVGIAPIVLTLFIAGVMKVPLASHWATTFFLLFGFFSFWLLRSGDDTALLRKTIIVVVAFQIIGAVGYGLARGPLADKSGRPSRATFPGAEISKLVHAEWNKRMQIPLTVVAADTWIGGNIATRIGRQVQVLIDGDYSKSPWVNEEHAEQCGMLVAINRSQVNPDEIDPGTIALMAQATEHGMIEIPWTQKANGPTVAIEWGIIPPRESCPLQPRSAS